MIKSTLRIAFAICLLISQIQVLGQSNQSQIKGRILDQNKQPVAYATAALYNTDSVLIKGEISNLDGYFTLNNIKENTYYLMVNHVEFAPKYVNNIEVSANNMINVGNIALSEQSVELSGVTVTAKRQMIEVLPDKMVFNVSSTVNASGNNGLELLSKAPGVIIDPDNNVILQGKSGVRIFINGRPSRLSGTDLTTFLESLQSDNIEKIELITNPSAKYEAEGNAGIINIELKKNVNLGYNGNFVHSYSKGSAARMSNGITINYGKNKLGFTANATRFDNSFYEGFRDITDQSGYNLRLKSDEFKDRVGYNLTSSITYDLSKSHSINISGGAITTTGDYDGNSRTNITNLENNAENRLLRSQQLTNYTSSNHNVNLNYRWKISDNSSLSSDFSYGKFKKDNNVYQPNTYFDESGTKEIAQINNAFAPNTDIDLYSAKLDYEKKFDNITLSSGVKYYEVQTKNQFTVSDVVDGVYTVNEAQSNTFDYTEQVGAIYVIGDFTLFDKFKMNAGIRMEQTASQGILESTQATENDNVKRNYLNFFPNVSVAHDFQKSKISLGFGKRITRPGYQDLNPFESKQSELSIWKGNPFLNPNYITNYQVTYTYNNALVISNIYSITEGYFARILEIVDETGTIIIPRNMRRSTVNGLSVSYPFVLTDWWEASAFAIYNWSTFQGEFENTEIDISTQIYNLRIQNTFELPWAVTANLSAYYNSPFIWRGSIEIKEFYGIDFGVRKDFFDGQLQIRLTGSDIFNTGSDFDYLGDYGGIYSIGTYMSDNHRFGFGLTYKFGNQKIKKQQNSNAMDDELNRL
ncbi:MAG: outer membrane beta-barrel family protein [Cyclobacteriaceae bacterium]